MATPNRSTIIGRMHKVLKKHYKPVPISERPALEHLLYACCLENAPYEAAEKAYHAVSTTFFDWNEVRVSTVKELAEVMHMLPEPAVAAANLKRVLQSVFEASYSFEIEALKKLPLGQAQQKLQKHEGVTHFGLAYVTQAALGGHAIPLDRGLLEAFYIVGVINEQEKASHSVPGLERAIAKNKGVEFGSLAHQLGADLVHSPYSPNVHKVLLEIAPDCKDRFPKRGGKPKPADAAAAKEKPEKEKQEKPLAASKPAEAPKPAKAAAHSAEEPKAAKAKAQPAAKKPEKKEPPAKPAPRKPVTEKKKSATAGLTKRKPR